MNTEELKLRMDIIANEMMYLRRNTPKGPSSNPHEAQQVFEISQKMPELKAEYDQLKRTLHDQNIRYDPYLKMLTDSNQ